MPLCTRLDGRSPKNRVVCIKDAEGAIVAIVRVASKSVDLVIDTKDGHYAEKLKENSNE